MGRIRAPSVDVSNFHIVHSRFGTPEEVAECVDRPVERIQAPDEVSIRMRLAPVNPADINMLEGTYGKRPELPSTPGSEGCGVVDAVGPEVTSVAVGDVVALIDGDGVWRSQMV